MYLLNYSRYCSSLNSDSIIYLAGLHSTQLFEDLDRKREYPKHKEYYTLYPITGLALFPPPKMVIEGER